MTDAIVQWLLSAGEGKFLAAVLISMLPVIELRGGLPAGVAMGLPLREALFRGAARQSASRSVYHPFRAQGLCVGPRPYPAPRALGRPDRAEGLEQER